MSQEEEEQSIFHPIIDDLILDDAGGISVSKVGGISALVIFVIFFSCALCLWKIPCYRSYIYGSITGIVQQCYNSCTTKGYREKKENLALRKDVADKKQMLLKNVEDLNIIKKFEEGMTRGQSLPALERSVAFSNHPDTIHIQVEQDTHGATGLPANDGGARPKVRRHHREHRHPRLRRDWERSLSE